jgi:hypothetical protein
MYFKQAMSFHGISIDFLKNASGPTPCCGSLKGWHIFAINVMWIDQKKATSLIRLGPRVF